MYTRFQSIPVLLFQLSFSILIPMFFQQPTAVSPRLQVTKSAVPVASSTTEPKRPTRNKMKPTNPNAHTYVNGTDVKTHGYRVTRNTFLQ